MERPDLPTIRAVLAELAPRLAGADVAPVAEGRSTWVYRIVSGEEVSYLRILPEADAAMSSEALVHGLLRERGLPVPQVLAVRDLHPLLGRSLMLTAAVPGRALAADEPPDPQPLLREAGRALAQINSVPVAGFGWIDRTRPGLRAPFRTFAEWMRDDLEQPLRALRQARLLPETALCGPERLLERACALFAHEPACLAHGDFDPTHLLHERGRLTGIIDFGEIRGAHRLYDLGHFAIEHPALLPALLASYREAAPLDADPHQAIALTAGLIAARRLGRRLLRQPGPVHEPDRQAVLRAVAEQS